MKKLFYCFVCLLIIACGTKRDKEKDTSEKIDTPATKEWLTFDGKDSAAKHIVFVSGDEEYRSEEALPMLAKIMSKNHGFKCTVLFAQDPNSPGIVNANYGKNIPGLEALALADLMVIFTRFRALPDGQMKHIDDYLKSGKPVVGMRTSTHAFKFNQDSISNYSHYGNYYSGDKTEWKDGFGRFILGEKWINHHGKHKHQSTKGIIADGAEDHVITNGINDGDVWGSTDVYGVRLPMLTDVNPIILGQVINRKGEFDEGDIFFGMKPTDDEIATANDKGLKLNDPMMPVAWTKTYQLADGKKGKVFTSTLGASTDLLIEGTRRLFVNGMFWAMSLDVPGKADVTIVGDYKPTKYEFRKNEYWTEKQLKVADLE
ncbi:ThuA domain-containing protein [Aureibaculum conchae]|uniref:ThuA domain-containing protein n=1 Tax=Aureibaculum sp. 2308TA14-22 TaxID=3108392 RepID=UPI003392FB43